MKLTIQSAGCKAIFQKALKQLNLGIKYPYRCNCIKLLGIKMEPAITNSTLSFDIGKPKPSEADF